MNYAKQLQLVAFKSRMPSGEVVEVESPLVTPEARTKKSNLLIRSGVAQTVSRNCYLLLQIASIKFCREIDRRLLAGTKAEDGQVPTDWEQLRQRRQNIASQIDWVAVSIDELRAFPSLAKVANLPKRIQLAAEELRNEFKYVRMAHGASGEGFGGSVVVNWAYDGRTGMLAFELNRWLRHMLYEVGSEYTVIPAEAMANLSSFRAQRFFEIFSSFLVDSPVGTLTKRFLSTDDLRSMLGVDPKIYQDSHEFRKRIIDDAIREVSAHTPLQITASTVMRHKQTVGYNFFARNRGETDPLTPIEKAVVDLLDQRQVSSVAARELARKHDPISILESIAQVEAFVAKTEERERRSAGQVAARTIGSKTGLLVAAIRKGSELRYGSTETVNRLKSEIAVFCWERGGLPAADRDRVVTELERRLATSTSLSRRLEVNQFVKFKDPVHPAFRQDFFNLLLDEHYAVRGAGAQAAPVKRRKAGAAITGA